MSDYPNEAPDTAAMVAPPPLLYSSALAAGLLWRTLNSRTPSCRAGSGGCLVCRYMHRAGTDVRPNKPTSSLVFEGSYRFTRNPMYLTFTLFYAGITAFAN